jgi:hypothetical protein
MPRDPKGEKRAADVIGVSYQKRLGSPYRSGRSPHWVKVKNPKAPAVKREAEEDWRR